MYKTIDQGCTGSCPEVSGENGILRDLARLFSRNSRLLKMREFSKKLGKILRTIESWNSISGIYRSPEKNLGRKFSEGIERVFPKSPDLAHPCYRSPICCKLFSKRSELNASILLKFVNSFLQKTFSTYIFHLGFLWLFRKFDPSSKNKKNVLENQIVIIIIKSYCKLFIVYMVMPNCMTNKH